MLILRRQHDNGFQCTILYRVAHHDWRFIDLLVRKFGDKIGIKPARCESQSDHGVDYCNYHLPDSYLRVHGCLRNAERDWGATKPIPILTLSHTTHIPVRKFGDKIGRGAVRYGKLDDTSYTLLEHTKKPSTPSVPHVIPVLDIGQDGWDVDDIIIIMPSVSDLNDNRTNTLAICDLPSRQDLITSAPLSTGTRAAAAVDVECCAIYTAIGAQSTPDSYIIITEGIIGSVTLHDDDGSYQGINIMYWIHGSCLNISHQLGPTVSRVICELQHNICSILCRALPPTPSHQVLSRDTYIRAQHIFCFIFQPFQPSPSAGSSIPTLYHSSRILLLDFLHLVSRMGRFWIIIGRRHVQR